jgi:hypothetical protein
VAGDQKFESAFLQGRVCKLSVPSGASSASALLRHPDGYGDRALQAAPKRPSRGVVFLMSRKIHDPLRSGRAVSPLAGLVLASVAPRSA